MNHKFRVQAVRSAASVSVTALTCLFRGHNRFLPSQNPPEGGNSTPLRKFVTPLPGCRTAGLASPTGAEGGERT